MTSAATDRAVALYDAGAHRQALEEAGRAIAADPDDGLAYVVAAGARRILGDLPGSLHAATQAARLLPDDPRPFTQLAYTRVRMRDFAAAEAAALEVVRLRPDSASSLVALADIRGRIPGAGWRSVEAAHEALALDPENVTALAILGEGYFDVRQMERSREAYARALALDPDDYRARHGMARVANFGLGRPTESIVRFSRMLAEAPGDVTILINLRAALLRLINRLFWVLLFMPMGAGIVFAVASGAGARPTPERDAPDPLLPSPLLPTPLPSISFPPLPTFAPTPLPTIVTSSLRTASAAAEPSLQLATSAIAAVCYGVAVWLLVALLVLITLRRIRPYARPILLLGWRDGPLRAFAIATAAIALPLPVPFGFPAALLLAFAAAIVRRVVISVIMQRNRARAAA